jgi:hypothetical protein
MCDEKQDTMAVLLHEEPCDELDRLLFHRSSVHQGAVADGDTHQVRARTTHGDSVDFDFVGKIFLL